MYCTSTHAHRFVTMNATAMFVLVFSVIVYVANAQLPPSCNRYPCQWLLASQAVDSERISEREAVVTLTCSLVCPDSTEQCITCSLLYTPSCDSVCNVTVESPVRHLLPPLTSPPLVSPALQEGVYTVTVPTPGTGNGQVKGYLVQVQDQFGNETYFSMTSLSWNISLLEFACSEVSISYAIVTVSGVSEYSPPQNVCVLPETVFELKGGTAYLNCSVLSTESAVAGVQALGITWTFTGINGSTQTIFQSSNEMMSNKYFVNTNTTDPLYRQLTIRGVAFEDSGSYRCHSDDTTIDTKVALAVHVPPKVLSVSRASSIEVDQQVNLTCLVSGHPQPTIKWQRDGNDILDQDNHTRVFTTIRDDLETLSTLQILNTQRTDSAHYTCTATNSFPEQQTGVQTTASPQVVLRILGGPDPPITVNASEFGAFWVFLRWIPGFNGNSPVETFTISASPDIRIRFEVSTADQNNNRFSLNITEGILPSTMYQFGVQTCNRFGCSNVSLSETIVTASNITNLDSTDEALNTALPIWIGLGAVIVFLVLIINIGVVIWNVRHRANKSSHLASVNSQMQLNDIYLRANLDVSYSAPDTSVIDPGDTTPDYEYATASPLRSALEERTGNPMYESVRATEENEEPTYDIVKDNEEPTYDTIEDEDDVLEHNDIQTEPNPAYNRDLLDSTTQEDDEW